MCLHHGMRPPHDRTRPTRRRRPACRQMETLIALVGFSFVSSITPGPNNLLLWASGAEFGFFATGRHVIGTALGIGAMALIAAAGIAELLAVVPGVELGLRLAASAYL